MKILTVWSLTLDNEGSGVNVITKSDFRLWRFKRLDCKHLDVLDRMKSDVRQGRFRQHAVWNENSDVYIGQYEYEIWLQRQGRGKKGD